MYSYSYRMSDSEGEDGAEDSALNGTILSCRRLTPSSMTILFLDFFVAGKKRGFIRVNLPPKSMGEVWGV